jgi:hypothetical protein
MNLDVQGRPFHRCTSSLGQVAINLRFLGETPNPKEP